MNKIALRFGYWAAITAAAAFIVFTICFTAILIVNPLFLWTSFEAYLEAAQATNQTFKHMAMFFMLVFGACFVVQLGSIEEIAEPAGKYYAKLAKLFGLGFFVLTGMNYFIQISAVRLQVGARQTGGLEQFIQSNPLSGMAATNMLGWTVFFGLSCLFAALAFGTAGYEKIIRATFFANGIMMLLTAGGYIFNLSVMVFLFMNIGMGAALPVKGTRAFKPKGDPGLHALCPDGQHPVKVAGAGLPPGFAADSDVFNSPQVRR